MEFLKKYQLDFTLSYNYFRDCLSDVNGLSTKLLEIVDFKSGVFFTLLKNGADVNKINNLKAIHIASGIEDQIRSFIKDEIDKNSRLSCIFDDCSSSYAPGYQGTLFSDCGVFYKDEIYYLINQETNSDKLLKRCFYVSDAIWHSLCILSEISLDCQNNKEITLDQINDMCLNVQLIMLGAYDGEGYVFWKKLIK